MTSAARITLVLASDNPHKLREFRRLLAELPLDVVAPAQVLGSPLKVLEDGETFEDNARKKGEAVAAATFALTLADDSGLEVVGLDGRPGVRSARFAHERATDAENNEALLASLADVEGAGRRARFRCVLALFDPWAQPLESPRFAEGRCEGVIARAPRGGGGFGYDPLFLVDGFGGRAMAELDDGEKDVVSHRGRAVANLLPFLREIVLARLEDVERVSDVRPSLLPVSKRFS
ncbi:MAG: RdgB/HAM1 family non-canonical purine NTP pyrophosphatase [Polyangiaceae bacterium]|nr:RdgB/HAM1 family non-canonical purine NTP pyrophosphatase [Polyangiaceae bacterium]